MSFSTADKILDFAIANEEDAFTFYTDLAGKMKNRQMAEVFQGYALEEKAHKAKLQMIKENKLQALENANVQSLDISDYLVDVEVTPDLDYQEALIVAMKQEKAAFKLYSDLAAMTDNAEIKSTFQMLAQEEAKHKLRFEIEYDEYILTDN